MRYAAALMLITVLAADIMAQSIDITGKVTSASNGSPLGNVVVTLKNTPGLADTTGADGTYHLLSMASGVQDVARGTPLSGSGFRNGRLEVRASGSEPVTIETYRLNGELVARILNNTVLPAGFYTYGVRESRANTDVMLIKVRQESKTTVYSTLSTQTSSAADLSANEPSGKLAKSAAFSDTLVFALSGYTTAKKAVSAATGVNDIALESVLSSQTVTDVDGNVYHTVTIGTQIWMLENLKTTKFNDGTAIPQVTVGNDWFFLNTPAYCWYANDSNVNRNTYGGIYDWYAVNTGKLAPSGWHVPTDAEWTTLIAFLGGETAAGGKMKESGTAHWASPNFYCTNASGFTALPGGYRNHYGTFYSIATMGSWWVMGGGASSCWTYTISNSDGSIVHQGIDSGSHGSSVRCIRD